MHQHEPSDYKCPFCRFLGDYDDELTSKADVVYETDHVVAIIGPRWWVHNPGSVLVIPKQHSENLYTISDEDLAKVYEVSKRVAIAMRDAYQCDGISTRQHNEPAGGQDVWHFHAHIFPRYNNDELYQLHTESRMTTAAERAPYATKLREALQG